MHIISNCILLLFGLMTMPVMAINIGDYQAETPTSGTIDISDIDQASFFDVQVKLSGKSINPILEQIDENLIRITIEDPQIAKAQNIIKVTVISPQGEKTRFFSYHPSTVDQITSEEQARANLEAVDTPAQTNVIVPVTGPESSTQNPGEFKDGILHININHAQASVGTAVTQLAKANQLNVLLLPGDELIHNVKLVSAVTDFDDLFKASDQVVKQVLIDHKRKLVRIVGQGQLDTDNTLAEVSLPDSTSIGELIKQVATVEGYTALIFPGMDEELLNTIVKSIEVKSIESLALIIGANGGMLEIDRQNKLIRARSSS